MEQPKEYNFTKGVDNFCMPVVKANVKARDLKKYHLKKIPPYVRLEIYKSTVGKAWNEYRKLINAQYIAMFGKAAFKKAKRQRAGQ